MPNFGNITFTRAVRALQERYGSRRAYAAMQEREQSEGWLPEIGEYEAQFIAERDSFYQATVSPDGWPYLQHRGGPKGFLQVLDSTTLGFADFSGNRQYISAGNLQENERISIFLMDYRQRRRLKILGRVKLVDSSEDPQLLARLENPAYRARVERAYVIKVEAFDWNCPQHITPRFSVDEVEQIVHDYQQEISELRSKLRSHLRSLQEPGAAAGSQAGDQAGDQAGVE